MFSRILVLVIGVLYIGKSESAPALAKARQYLPPVPGYVPVYIRPGDTPLEDINLDLAEAFKSYARKQARLAFARSHIPVIVQSGDDQKVTLKDVTSLNLAELDDVNNFDEKNEVLKTTEKTPVDGKKNIQKIPRH